MLPLQEEAKANKDQPEKFRCKWSRKRNAQKQEQDPQVAYGEVKVSGKSKAARRTPNEQADTIYSGIRT
ncbi:hypothetical protein ANANG_G00072540 [Anguilla anguilla]|uniref:Uncharacterized protein n=1 Tax=Anguilla anguilla TaxID=7936 RepID=A0A9D3MQT9_ANGAN|nr:hypothetical protein ANANG_G00072540 [Anguilla anguilla]